MEETEFIKTLNEKLEDLVFFITKNLSDDERKELITKFNSKDLIGDEGVITLKHYDMKIKSHQIAFLSIIIKNYLIYNLIQLSIKTDELINMNPTERK